MSNNYAGKFVSAETAVKAVQPGDWVDYGFGAGFPELLDRALAARRDELTDVKIRGGLVIRPRIEVVESDPEQKAFSYYSWHIGDYERKLQTRGLCKFMPMMLRSLPEMYRHHIRVDVAFVPVSRPDADGCCGLGISNYAWRTIFENARTVIFEINERLPRLQGVDGSHRVHLSEADFIVEGEHVRGMSWHIEWASAYPVCPAGPGPPRPGTPPGSGRCSAGGSPPTPGPAADGRGAWPR